MTNSVFINYRRDETAGVAGRLHDKLAGGLPKGSVFMDVDAMVPGIDFTKQLGDQVGKCSIVLAIIGPGWVDAKDDAGNRRLDNPKDWVRVELSAALHRDIPVVPGWLDGAVMPRPDELPDDLVALANRQAVDLRHARFRADADAILAAVRSALGVESSTSLSPLKIAGGIFAAFIVLIGLAIGLSWRPAIFRADQSGQEEGAKRQHEAEIAASANEEARQAEERRREAEAAAAAAVDRRRQAEQSQRDAEAAAAAAEERERAAAAAASTATQASVNTNAPPAEQPPPATRQTFWSHNGSIVYLVVEGQRRRFYYEQPRPGMIEAGASKGALLFDGQVQGGSYVGTAYVFDNRCGSRSYYVGGPISDDGSRVVMRGAAPRVNHDCQAASYLNDTLEFKLLPGQ